MSYTDPVPVAVPISGGGGGNPWVVSTQQRTDMKSDDLYVFDNIIELNTNETADGVTKRYGGFEIYRGPHTATYPSYKLYYDDVDHSLKCGFNTATFDKLGIVDHTDATPNTILGWDGTKFSNSSGLDLVHTQYVQNMNQSVSSTSNVTFHDVLVTGTLTANVSIDMKLHDVVTNNYTMLSSDALVVWNGTANGTFTLLPAAAVSGRLIVIENISTLYDLDINAPLGNTIDSTLSTIKITANHKGHLTLLSDGHTNWMVI